MRQSVTRRLASAAIAVATALATVVPAGPVALAATDAGAITAQSTVQEITPDNYYLKSGTYHVPSTMTIAADSRRKNGIVIAYGAHVLLIIDEGDVLTVTGRNAEDGSTGYGGAAIWLSAGSTLTVGGEGTLIAKGGDAGDGNSGYDGQDSKWKFGIVNGWEKAVGMYSGKGGDGGKGGGGAGAGIGTDGGLGGRGGTGGAGAYADKYDILG